jgi:hypothetical protein
VSIYNAAFRIVNGQEVTDDVPEGTVVYFTTFAPAVVIPQAGGPNDLAVVALYG